MCAKAAKIAVACMYVRDYNSRFHPTECLQREGEIQVSQHLKIFAFWQGPNISSGYILLGHYVKAKNYRVATGKTVTTAPFSTEFFRSVTSD